MKEALTDPCLHCSMLPLSERQLRLAELDNNSPASLAQQPRRAQKRRASAAAGAPPSKKKSSRQTETSEHLLSKTVATLSSEMMEMKRLLQSLQPPALTTHTENTPVDESDLQPSHDMDMDLDALSMSASNSHFLDAELAEPATQPTLPHDVFSNLSVTGGSSGGSVHSSGAGPSSPDDILSILQMAVARLGLDESPVQPVQANVFFRQAAKPSTGGITG